MPAIISMYKNNNCKVIVENCAPYVITIERNDMMGLIKIKDEKLILLTDNIISSVCAKIHTKLPKIQKAKLSHEDIVIPWRHCPQMSSPSSRWILREIYINTLFKHQEAISIDKYDMGLAKELPT